jgi:hypothetical protein
VVGIATLLMMTAYGGSDAGCGTSSRSTACLYDGSRHSRSRRGFIDCDGETALMLVAGRV